MAFDGLLEGETHRHWISMLEFKFSLSIVQGKVTNEGHIDLPLLAFQDSKYCGRTVCASLRRRGSTALALALALAPRTYAQQSLAGNG
jgi:hypothetical protein